MRALFSLIAAGLVLSGLTMIAQSASADCTGIAANDTGAAYRLGSIPIGTSAEDLRAAIGPLQACSGTASSGCQDQENQYGTGPDGLHYYLQGDRVIRKTLTDTTQYRRTLIGDIRLHEALNATRAKVGKAPVPKSLWLNVEQHGKTGAIIYTDLCWRGATGTHWGLALFHDADGRLSRVEEIADFQAIDRAGANCPGDVVDLPDRLYSLGAVPVGALRSQLPASAKGVHPCDDDSTRDCDGAITDIDAYKEYLDTDHVHYLVDPGGKIVQAEVRDLTSYPKPLPAGLRAGDDKITVARKISGTPLDDMFYDLLAPSNGDEAIVNGKLCLRNTTGQVWGYVLIFNKGQHLQAISQEVGPLPEQ